eukprot:1310554-Alexandrium_andersonii.AAC.1
MSHRILQPPRDGGPPCPLVCDADVQEELLELLLLAARGLGGGSVGRTLVHRLRRGAMASGVSSSGPL